MKTPRKSIKLTPDERDSLARHYVETGIPTDRFPELPSDLARFVSVWNGRTGRGDSDDDVLNYMVTRRKDGKWPKLGVNCRPRSSYPTFTPTDDQWAALETVYRETCVAKGLGSDCINCDASLAREVAIKFAQRTGLGMSGRQLFALIMKRRKRGDWVRVRDNKPRGIGFGDIDQIG